MLIKFGFGQLHIGRPTGIDCAENDAALTLCLGWRGDVPPSEPQWRYVARAAWDWLPVRNYRAIGAVVQHLSLQETAHRNTVASISGRRPNSLNSEYLLPAEYAGAIDSSRWTGRDRKFVGFGAWRRNLCVYRSTWRAKMFVYLTGAKERNNPKHVLRVAPGAMLATNEIPADWREEDGSPKKFEIEFIHGRASVDSRLGEFLVKREIAQKTNLIRRAGASTLGALAATIAGR